MNQYTVESREFSITESDLIFNMDYSAVDFEQVAIMLQALTGIPTSEYDVEAEFNSRL